MVVGRPTHPNRRIPPEKRHDDLLSPSMDVRRLASRALNGLERHQDKEPALTAYTGSLLLSAEACLAAYDKAQRSNTGRDVRPSRRHLDPPPQDARVELVVGG